MNQGKSQNLRSEMNPEITGVWNSIAVEECRRMAPEYQVDPCGATYSRAVLKPRDQNRDRSLDFGVDNTPPGKLGKPRTGFRKQPGKLGQREYRETKGLLESKCPAEEYAYPQYVCKDLEECRSQTSDREDPVQGPSCAEVKPQQSDRDRGCDIVSAPARARKPRFTRLKTRRQQKKQNEPKKEEPVYLTILKRDELNPLTLQTFEEAAEQFCFTDECTAMMTHLELNKGFERMPYTAML